ncbi:MAG: transporter ATP-binding protein [Herbinix sp.]|jgi:putative ABC transport system ATP-binding protein|nr:transporter ATP-binding protein [Herbinix sp.]
MEILSLQNVEYTYRNKYQTVNAVNHVSYHFESGKIYAIVGKSGSGKTTLLSLLAGLDLPTQGEVFYKETPTKLIDCDLYRRDKVTVIYQSYNLFPLLTILENVMYPLRLNKVGKKEAEEVAINKLKSVGLDEQYYKRLPSMLSGGEQQRVAIARALASKADVILADEPTGNLDSENSINIIEILKRLAHEENYCVIVVTHDLAISDEADVIIRMADGKIHLDEM